MLEAVKIEVGEALLGKDIGKTEGKLLFEVSHYHQHLDSHKAAHFDSTYLEPERRLTSNGPDP